MNSVKLGSAAGPKTTRSAILNAAVKEMLARGYEGAKLSDVAATASVSTATLHKYFPTKRALFGGVMERFWENDGAGPPPMPSPGETRAGLRKLGLSYVELLIALDTVPLFRLIISENLRFPELGRELYERGKRPYLDRLEAYVRAECFAGRLIVEDPSLAVRQLVGMINDVVFWPRLLVSDLAVTQAEAKRVVDEAVATFLARYAAKLG